ncbi:hypothetical protein D0C36_18680 [Mucilaginibacter conchicola]|uniref:Uncharacterized protein n=1 Tax=Mucilaginibacter conchicola TaxID=2303333 RepID=A0A372NPX0_9SPHI|nr:hypothetical protein [Mucilaginibacter conchicola]RFZ90972.1 hypothetical protein D0C36_18680 [Mucilaginibacter conchicola]
MALKGVSKTHWKIEPTRVTIYPYRVFNLFAPIVGVIFMGLLFVYFKYQNAPAIEVVPLALFIFIMIALFWAFAATRIEFDNSTARMRKMLMGFLPVTSIPFSKLQGIKPVTNMGSYNYRLFRKSAKYGKGIIVSSGYTKNDDPNAIAFVEEAVPAIHAYLDMHDSPADNITETITSYRFFEQEDGYKYAIKTKKAGAIVIGIIFLAMGIYLATIKSDSLGSKIFVSGIVLCFAAVFINAAYTKITFDISAKTVQRDGLLKFFNRQYSINNFAGIQTVRRSVNFVYAGTDVNMYFNVPEKGNKQDTLMVISMKKSADIERFIQELYQVMETKV